MNKNFTPGFLNLCKKINYPISQDTHCIFSKFELDTMQKINPDYFRNNNQHKVVAKIRETIAYGNDLENINSDVEHCSEAEKRILYSIFDRFKFNRHKIKKAISCLFDKNEIEELNLLNKNPNMDYLMDEIEKNLQSEINRMQDIIYNSIDSSSDILTTKNDSFANSVFDSCEACEANQEKNIK